MRNLHQIDFTSQLKNVEKLDAFVEQLQLAYQLNDNQTFNVKLVLTEAVNNSIAHGNRFHPSKKVEVVAEYNNGTLQLRVRDEGEGFNPNKVPDPTCDSRIEKPNGRGVYLMRQLSDRLSYKDSGRAVVIHFNLEQ